MLRLLVFHVNQSTFCRRFCGDGVGVHPCGRPGQAQGHAPTWLRWVAVCTLVGFICLQPSINLPPAYGQATARADQPFGAAGAQALIEVTPFGNLNASTYNDNSFRITNTATGGQTITSLTVDLSTTVLPDIVFDPDGKAGDLVAKAFTPNDGTVATGYLNHQLRDFHNGSNDNDGFKRLTVNFNDFAPGENFGFSIDIDPTTIKGTNAPGPGESGSVSGLELIGATVTVTFSDGTTATSALFHRENSDSGSENMVRNPAPAQPAIALPGVNTPTTLFAAAQAVRVNAPAGSTIRLLRLEGALFVQAGGAYDLDAFEANSVVAWQAYRATVNDSGTVTIPVTLAKTGTDGGLNYLVAVVEGADGMTGSLSNRLVVDYAPEGNTAPTLAPLADQQSGEGNRVLVTVTATDPDTRPQPLTFSGVNLPPGLTINPTTGTISGLIALGAAAQSPYAVTVTVSDGADQVERTFSWTVTASPTSTPTITVTPAPSATPTPSTTAQPSPTPTSQPTATPTVDAGNAVLLLPLIQK